MKLAGLHYSSYLKSYVASILYYYNVDTDKTCIYKTTAVAKSPERYVFYYSLCLCIFPLEVLITRQFEIE